jgi:hypothetical protein
VSQAAGSSGKTAAQTGKVRARVERFVKQIQAA